MPMLALHFLKKDCPCRGRIPIIRAMAGDSSATAAEDFDLARRILAGDMNALGALREGIHAILLARLRARNIPVTEAEDLLSDLWGDCVPASEQETEIMVPDGDGIPGDAAIRRQAPARCVLERYTGRSPLRSFLFTVVFRRFLDQQRRRRFVVTPPEPTGNASRTSFIHALPDPDANPADSFLVASLKAAIQSAIKSCPNDAWLIFQLVYQHGIPQHIAGALWGWKDYETSRQLKSVKELMKTVIVNELNQADPHLNLGWDEALDICQTLDLGFMTGE